MNTLENNKIIAEFMGMNPHDKNELDGFWTNTIKAHKFDNVMNLQFDSDWNWLMEVVEKIEKTQRSKFSPNTYPVVTINAICCNIKYHGNNVEIITETIRPSKIEAVCDACVEFIKWYNQKKPKP